MLYYFSPTTLGFYPEGMKDDYVKAGSWPDDGIPVSEDTWSEFVSQAPDGKTLGVVDGNPAWVDLPEQLEQPLMAARSFTTTEQNPLLEKLAELEQRLKALESQ